MMSTSPENRTKARPPSTGPFPTSPQALAQSTRDFILSGFLFLQGSPVGNLAYMWDSSLKQPLSSFVHTVWSLHDLSHHSCSDIVSMGVHTWCQAVSVSIEVSLASTLHQRPYRSNLKYSFLEKVSINEIHYTI